MFVWLRNGDIAVAKIKIIRTWDASQNFDDNGTYTHHFPVLVVPNPRRHFSQAPLLPPPINPGQPQNQNQNAGGGTQNNLQYDFVVPLTAPPPQFEENLHV